MKKIKRFLCKEDPRVLSVYLIVALIIAIEVYMMGLMFFVISLAVCSAAAIIFVIGYGLMRVIKRLQLNCVEDSDVKEEK